MKPVMRRVMCGSVLVVAVLAMSRPSAATVPLIGGLGGPIGYGWNCLSPNDDGSSALIDLGPAFPFGLRFFTTTHTSAYVNTNGNITFSGALPTYTPAAFPVASRPMIAPYWADVDIRWHDGFCDGPIGTSPGYYACESPTDNGVWWWMEPGRFIVTWDNVGYYSCHVNLVMDFQLVLTAAEGCAGAGDFDVEFRFNTCQWTTGDASGGSGGFGGTAAQAGFDAGNSVDFVEIPGSRSPTIHTTLCNDSNVGVPGLWRYEIRSGTIVCPDAGLPCDTGLLGACAEGVTQCVGSGTVCSQVVEPSPERCDALDNDCDGETDEGDGLCSIYEVCVDGNCEERCSEFGCPTGQVCGPDDICVDAECLYVDCPPGQRCVDGTCVGACDGVVCPHGLQCRSGRCVDLCETIECDECTVCEDGVCVTRCAYEPCPAGEECQADGSCLETACATVTCPEGQYCEGGACLDSCAGAVCPVGEVCELGACVPYEEPPPPEGPPEVTDTGTTPDAPPDMPPDADIDAVTDPSGDVPWDFTWSPAHEGCGCSLAR